MAKRILHIAVVVTALLAVATVAYGVAEVSRAPRLTDVPVVVTDRPSGVGTTQSAQGAGSGSAAVDSSASTSGSGSSAEGKNTITGLKKKVPSPALPGKAVTPKTVHRDSDDDDDVEIVKPPVRDDDDDDEDDSDDDHEDEHDDRNGGSEGLNSH